MEYLQVFQKRLVKERKYFLKIMAKHVLKEKIDLKNKYC